MAKFRSLLNRVIPLILALVLVISLFPAVPSFAAEASSSEGEPSTVGDESNVGVESVSETYALSGVWLINSSPSITFAYSQLINFVSNGQSFHQFSLGYSNSPITLRTVGFVYGSPGSELVYNNGSWSSPSYQIVDFGSSPQAVSLTFYNWFTSNATKQVTFYTHTISIEDSSYVFRAEKLAPPVTIEVTSSGITMSYGDSTQTWTYSGSDTFVGVKDSSGNIYHVGSSSSLIGSPGSNITSVLTPLTETPSQNTYTHTISIDGSSYIFTSENKAPPVTIEVTSSGFTMSYGDSTQTWTYSGSDTFVGIMNSSGNTYDVGAYFSILGSLGSTGYDVTSVLTPLTEPLSQNTYSHTISIDGSSYIFTSENKAPPVTIEVTSSGITMSYGDTTKTWTYLGSDTFVGIKDSSGYTYDVGAYFSLLGSLGTPGYDVTSVLTPLIETPSQDTFITLVKLYDSTGSTLLKSFSASSDATSPSVTLAIAEKQLIFDSSALDSPILWDYTGAGSILGIDFSANVSSPSYTPGQTIEFNGAPAQDSVTCIYLFTDSPSQNTYTTLVELYDSSGNSLLTSFIASSDAASPSSHLTIGGKQLVFVSSALDSAITWNYTGDGTILGIALSANATAPSYTSGQAMTFGGISNQDSVTRIYLITDSDSGNDFVIPAGQYEAKKAIMTGEYVALPSWPADLDSVPFAFKSSGLNYQSMSLGMYLPTSQAQLQYGSTAAYRYAGIDQSAGFTQDAFALVYLASDQAVPEAFYNWFTSAFTRISDELVSPTYSATINIWNAAGTSVLRTVTYSGTLCPVVTLQVTENGCIISCPGQDSIEWSTSGEFYGFRLYKVSTNAIYTPGNSYSLPGGAAADVVVDLFYADTASESQVQELFSGISSFLVQPIMVFFNIEFIPGLSFSRIAMFAFLLGLVWWFLKVSK